MDGRESLVKILNTSRDTIMFTVADISEEDSKRRPRPDLAPIVWQIGHLAVSNQWMLATHFGASADVPETYGAMFATGTGREPATYPPLEDVRRAFAQSVQRMADLAGSRPLDTPAKNPPTLQGNPVYSNLGDMTAFAILHQGWHLGKIATLRAMLGKPRLFDAPPPSGA